MKTVLLQYYFWLLIILYGLSSWGQNYSGDTNSGNTISGDTIIVAKDQEELTSQSFLRENNNVSAKEGNYKFDLYSETTSQANHNSVVHQSRIRALFSRDEFSLQKFAFYLGIGLDRELSSPKERWIQNSWRPQIGILWKPVNYFQGWIEYNRRYYSLDNQQGMSLEENDPRAGVALGYDFFDFDINSDFKNFSHQVKIETYSEAVTFWRLSNQPVFSGHVRPIYQISLNENFSISPYAELYFQRSPMPELGRQTNQIRGGLQFMGKWKGASAALFHYWAKEINDNSVEDGEPTILLVLGGTF